MMIYFIISKDAAFFQQGGSAKGRKSKKKLRSMNQFSPSFTEHSLSLSAIPTEHTIVFFLTTVPSSCTIERKRRLYIPNGSAVICQPSLHRTNKNSRHSSHLMRLFLFVNLLGRTVCRCSASFLSPSRRIPNEHTGDFLLTKHLPVLYHKRQEMLCIPNGSAVKLCP